MGSTIFLLILVLLLSSPLTIRVNSKPHTSPTSLELSSEETIKIETSTQLPPIIKNADDSSRDEVEVKANMEPPDPPPPISALEIPSSQRHRTNADTFRYKIASAESKSDEFADQSRRTFLSLSSNTKRPPHQVEQSTALLTEEERRRQIWLSRHHQRKTEAREQSQDYPGGGLQKNDVVREEPQRVADPLVNPKNLLTLTSADVINQTQTCTGDLFKHKVRVSGCEPKIIINRFCHGSCTSFYIPRLRAKKLKATFQSCSVCVPSETDLVQVKLNCPNREEGEIYRRVMRVKKCACRSIEVEADTDDDYDENDADDLGY